MRGLLLLAFAACAFAGQSLSLDTQYASASVAAQSNSTECTVEFQPNWSTLPTSFTPEVQACGFNLSFVRIGGALNWQPYWARDTGSMGVCDSGDISGYTKPLTFRFSIKPSINMQSCEVYDGNGVLKSWGHQYGTGASGSNSNGALIQGPGTGTTVDYGFFRVKTSYVGPEAGMPKTADTSFNLLNWRFDSANNTGTLADISGNNYTAVMSSGSPTYVAQAGQTLTKAVPTTCDAPFWNDWRTMRVGQTGSLCSSRSLSMRDDGTLTCSWSQTAGATLTIASPSACTTNITGQTFGTYSVSLTVTDVAAGQSTATLTFGATTCDDNGIAQPRSAAVTRFLGKMICFGYNPWGYADERQKKMVDLQLDYQPTYPWNTLGAGTVAYKYNGVNIAGQDSGACTNTLSGGINATDTSIAVTDAACLDLSSFPTWIYVGTEIVRVSATTATSGAATLTVAYNGRGLSGFDYAFQPQTIAAASHSAGEQVGSFRVNGTSTTFSSGAVAACPGGAPGPPGPVAYSTGTVTLSASSTTVTGSGTTWNSTNGARVGNFIRIAATHGGGTSFIFWSRIASVTDTTHLVLDRAAPSDIDGSSFSYKLIGRFNTDADSLYYNSLNMEFLDGSGDAHYGIWGIQGCESDTVMFALGRYNPAGLQGSTQTGRVWSNVQGYGLGGGFGPNFYGTGLAARSFYERSGYEPARTLANRVDSQWIRDPYFSGGWSGFGQMLGIGGGIYSALAYTQIESSPVVTWKDFRKFADLAYNGQIVPYPGCNALDTRETGMYNWTVLVGAILDPSPTTWVTRLINDVLARDTNCEQADHSFANAFYFGGPSYAASVTNGSAAVTSASNAFVSGACDGLDIVTVSVTNGSASITVTSGTINASANAIVLGARSYRMTRNSSTTATLAALWPGSTGSVAGMTRLDVNGNSQVVFADNNDSASLIYNYACKFNNSGSVTLDRPYDGSTDSSTFLYAANIAGKGQQPYMTGILQHHFALAMTLGNTTLTNGYAPLRANNSTWERTTGYDPVTKGLYYGRIFQFCESGGTPTGSFDFTTPVCSGGLSANGIRAFRALTPEMMTGVRAYYETQNYSDAARSWGDEAYGAVFGDCIFTTSGYPCDRFYVRDELSDANMGSAKWPGFFFGLGRSYEWPALRLEAAASPGRRGTTGRFSKVGR